MCVKLWKLEFDENSEVDIKLNQLITMYVEAIQKYFRISSNTDNFNQLFKELENVETNLEQELFKDWVLSKGKHFLEDLSSKKFENREESVAKIDYQIYMLEDELDLQFPEDLIAALIGIAEELPSSLTELDGIAATYKYDQQELLNIDFDWAEDQILESVLELATCESNQVYLESQSRMKVTTTHNSSRLYYSSNSVGGEYFIYIPNGLLENDESPRFVEGSFSVQ